MSNKVIFYKPPGLGTWLGLLLGAGSTRQLDVFLAYKSKSGSKIVPTGLDPVASITCDDSWHVPFPRADILVNEKCHQTFFLKSVSENYPKANVTHSASFKHKFKHLSRTSVSVLLKVFSNGSIAPRAIRSKQSVMKKFREGEICFSLCRLNNSQTWKLRLHHRRNQLLMLIHLKLLSM